MDAVFELAVPANLNLSPLARAAAFQVAHPVLASHSSFGKTISTGRTISARGRSGPFRGEGNESGSANEDAARGRRNDSPPPVHFLWLNLRTRGKLMIQRSSTR